MPRVLFVDHVNRILGGAEINLIELLEAWPVAGMKTVACACPLGSPLANRLTPLGIPVLDYDFGESLNRLRLVGRTSSIRAGLASVFALRAARRRLEAIFAEFRPQVVVSCANKDHLAASAACQKCGLPSVWWVNDVVSADFFPRAARFAFRRQARTAAARLVAVSEFAREALLRLQLPPERTVTIHNGIPLKRYQRTDRGRLRVGLGLPPDQPLIGIVGRFTPWKGQDFFLQLAEAWSQRHAAGQFVLVGRAFNEDQDFETALHHFVESRSLGARVRFVPFQDSVIAALSDLDVLVHASTRPEPFGRVLIEAMAVGVPVVAARAGGVPEIITDGVDGLLAQPGDLKEYSAQLEKLLSSPDLARTLSRAALATARRYFTIERVAHQFAELFAVVAAERAFPGTGQT